SGEAPQVPVANRKSGKRSIDNGQSNRLILIGTVFEKRLIEAYVSEHGKDPVTNEELTNDDLVELKSTRIVRPRPPTLTSIPSLLSVFQSEWDALAHEIFNLRQQLLQTRQELSTALYQNDAAVRVVARLSRERDEAREALSTFSITGATATSGDAMQVDYPGLSEALVAKVEATQEKLSKTRRKRTVPDGWVDSESLGTFSPIEKSNPLFDGSRKFSLDASGDLALLGGNDGLAGVYSISQRTLLHKLNVGSYAVTDALWASNQAVLATSGGTVSVFEDGVEVATVSAHAGEVTALAIHPSGEILASIGEDKSLVFYDLTSNTPVKQVQTSSALTAAAFHPDGHLFAAGGTDGQIKVFDVKSGVNVANFEAEGPIQDMEFSENGTWLASAVGGPGSSAVSIWDLRKSTEIKSIQVGSPVVGMKWDYTGQFLAIASSGGVIVWEYSKASKVWSEPLRSGIPAISVAWGVRAKSIVALDGDGALTVLSPQ
ncbi:MAG: hypothetical protein Q9214_001111, partial [Letrouitia sp. 1 TL-2023]